MHKITLHTVEGKRDVFIPSKWRELTLGQLIGIDAAMREDPPDILKCFAVLSGLSLDITKNLNDDKIEQKVFQILQFLNTPPDWENLKHPATIILNNIPCKIPYKIGSCMLGQKIMLLQALSDTEKVLNNTPLALAVMLQPYFDRQRNKGKLIYNDERVNHYEKEMNKLNGLDAYALAVFFFKKYKISLLIGKKHSKTCQQLPRKIKRLSQNWLKLKDYTLLQTLK